MIRFNDVRGIAIAIRIVIAFLPVCLQAQGLHLAKDTRMVMNGNPVLVFNNAGLINDGEVIAGNSTIIFTGDKATANSFIGGENPIAFFNLVIDKSSNDVQLNNNAAVSGNIVLKNGNLQLNQYTMDLGASGSIIGETNNSHITGTQGGFITAMAILNGPQAVNPGNIGIELTSASNLGPTFLSRGHMQQTDSAGETSIQRYFEIEPTFNTDIHATLRFYYLDCELAGKDKNTLSLFSSGGERARWASRGRDANNTEAGWVVKNNMDQLHRVTLASDHSGLTKTGFARVYPNPTHDLFTITLVSTEGKNIIMNMYDQTGRFIEARETYCFPGINTIEWNMAKYASGIYYVTFKNMIAEPAKILKQ